MSGLKWLCSGNRTSLFVIDDRYLIVHSVAHQMKGENGEKWPCIPVHLLRLAAGELS